MAAQSKSSAPLTSPGYLIPFITVTALFFIFGFITNLNMALVPHLQRPGPDHGPQRRLLPLQQVQGGLHRENGNHL